MKASYESFVWSFSRKSSLKRVIDASPNAFDSPTAVLKGFLLAIDEP